MGVLLRHEGCNSCGSSDAKAIYQDEDGSESSHCWSCGKTVASKEYIESKNAEKTQSKRKVKTNAKENMQEGKVEKIKEPISDERKQEIHDNTSVDLKGWREITKETSKHFGVRAEYSEDTGEITRVYYPTTRDGKLVGYKSRVLPKTFSGIGDTTASVECFGQFRYKNKASKYCLITEGEQCALAAYQMLKDYQDTRGGDYEPPVVVGITVGAQSAHKQIAANYAFFEQFSKVIYAADLDKPGQDSIDDVAKALPRGKAFILKGDLKDCAEYLEKGKEKSFVNYFFKAQAWTPASLHSSNELYEEALKYADLDKVALPEWLGKMNDMLAGGIPKGTLTLIAAASSIGKSTFVNQLIVDCIMENKTKPENRKEVFGILSLEATAGEFATQLLSYHCKQKFINIKDREERVKIMSQPDVAQKAKELFSDNDGLPSFLLCDDRGADLDDVEEKIEEMIRSMGITILIIDVTSDLFSGVENSRQEAHMAFQKRLVKETGVSIWNVVHTRKTPEGGKDGSRGAELTDSSIIGSSTLVKSASVVIGLIRDKMADTELERNTVKLRILKSRHAGATGDAGNLYYDSQEHRLVDLDKWLEENGTTEF